MNRPSAPAHQANRLIREKSPYLLQHAHNPVDWYPWGEEAFEKARREDKPIFLSIGYSTCHWCHVMERESFENEAVAELLNRDYVPIKVDREERPDVDRVYMTATQAMGVGGGWPLNVFLTPDRKPFYGGTYFPPTSRSGRTGMVELLPNVIAAWRAQRTEIDSAGSEVLAALAQLGAANQEAADADTLMRQCVHVLEQSFDRDYGGFGGAPKFPSTVQLNLLLRWWARDPTGRESARMMVLRQLDAMRAAGLHDHLGGGFHRYATDREWGVPHFEKMLYDQALLAWAYLEGFQVGGREEYADAARGIFAYVERDLSSSGGGFDSAEDADSEGEEGKFYVWTPPELEAALGKDDAALFARRYGVTPQGNFEHGASILHESHSLEQTASAFQLAPDEAARRLATARTTLLAVRSKRERPHRDDKVIAAWNGLMISAFARGARVLREPALAERAVRAAEFVWTRLFDPATGTLQRRWRDGAAGGAGQLDDYAYFALGLLDLYSATHDPTWLERAAAVTDAQLARFWDDADGACFESPAGDDSIALRMKDGYDGAEMAGNSIAASNLLRLAGLLERSDLREKAGRTLQYYARRLAGNAYAMPQMLVAMDLASAPPRHTVIVGDPSAPATRALLEAFDRRFLPTDERLVVPAGADPAAVAARATLARLAPFAAALASSAGRATAYVCENYACQLPVHDPEALGAQLDESSRPAKEPR